jgi:predicted transcriptional regulator
LKLLGVSSQAVSYYYHFNDDFEQRAESISNTVLNILTAMSVMVDGVREILPFLRPISQFCEVEWNTIKAQDHGKGVICAATW